MAPPLSQKVANFYQFMSRFISKSCLFLIIFELIFTSWLFWQNVGSFKQEIHRCPCFLAFLSVVLWQFNLNIFQKVAFQLKRAPFNTIITLVGQMSKTFHGAFYIFSSYMFPLWKKNFQILLLPKHRMVHIIGKNARTWEKCNISFIGRTHLSREIRHLNLQNRECTCPVLFSATCPITFKAQLLFDFIKHEVAHFAPFLAPFLLVLAILWFQDTKICWFFSI